VWGPAARGPVDEPRHLTSWTEFERIYGGLSANSLMSDVVHCNHNGVGEADIVRIAAGTPRTVIDLNNGVKPEPRTPGTAGNDLKDRGRPRPG
jgi:hypothetical protein